MKQYKQLSIVSHLHEGITKESSFQYVISPLQFCDNWVCFQFKSQFFLKFHFVEPGLFLCECFAALIPCCFVSELFSHFSQQLTIINIIIIVAVFFLKSGHSIDGWSFGDKFFRSEVVKFLSSSFSFFVPLSFDYFCSLDHFSNI